RPARPRGARGGTGGGRRSGGSARTRASPGEAERGGARGVAAAGGLLQMLGETVATRDPDFAARLLDIQLLHYASLHEHGIALRARAETVPGAVERQLDGPGELAIAVGEEHDLVVRVGVALPGAHDENVVDAGDRNRIDTFGLDGVGVLDDRRHVHL